MIQTEQNQSEFFKKLSQQPSTLLRPQDLEIPPVGMSEAEVARFEDSLRQTIEPYQAALEYLFGDQTEKLLGRRLEWLKLKLDSINLNQSEPREPLEIIDSKLLKSADLESQKLPIRNVALKELVKKYLYVFGVGAYDPKWQRMSVTK